MKNIIYFTGAGFSAPLGIPVMSNFIQKSKDLFQDHPDKFKHFTEIFNLINDLSKIKLHIDLDLKNIEDIFSLLEMRHFIDGEKDALELYKTYIRDTIVAFTPIPMKKVNLDGSLNWEEFWIEFKDKRDISLINIASFIKYLYGIDLQKQFISGSGEVFGSTIKEDRDYRYSIVTLNYDKFPEMCIDYINDNFPNQKQKYDLSDSEVSILKYIKLHGSIESNINIPSWNKVSNAPERGPWRAAFELIKNANEIRILGYSLPETDAYVKYLFGVGLKESFNLQKVDIITLDSDRKTIERYKKIFDNSGILRCKVASLTSYFENQFSDNRMINYRIDDQIFERRHDLFMTPSD